MSAVPGHPETLPKWWKEATIYQIYPASFKDSNDDGWGDMNGIASKLEYIRDLGCNAIWLSPFYDSPQDDMGYDVANYKKVWPTYGTNEDCFRLIEKAHKLGMKFITDLVINHCSSEHEWFKESRSSKTNAKRDWFFWRPPKGFDNEGKPIPPNNWKSYFGGSAWTFDEHTKEFYLRLFAETQPDLNWENDDCRHAIYEDAVGFWLDHGVDGFRVDAGGLYSKTEGLPDAPITIPDSKWQPCEIYHRNGPRIHEWHQEMNQFMKNRVKDGREIMTVGEMAYSTDEDKKLFTSAARNELSQIFQFSHIDYGLDSSFRYNLAPTELKYWKLAIQESFSFINGNDAWSTIYMENHDQARSISRFCDDSPKNRVICGKLLSVLLTSLTGTLYVYQGQELGQVNFKDWPFEKYEDVEFRNNYNAIKEEHGVESEQMKRYLEAVAVMSRDHARTPMPWTHEEPNAGFCGPKAKPWFSLNESFRDGIDAEDEIEDSNSVLHFWRKALKFRNTHKDIAVYGYDFEFVDLDNKKLFSFTKRFGQKTLFAALNFSSDEVAFEIPNDDSKYSLVFGNYPTDKVDASSRSLKAWEGRVYILDDTSLLNSLKDKIFMRE